MVGIGFGATFLAVAVTNESGACEPWLTVLATQLFWLGIVAANCVDCVNHHKQRSFPGTARLLQAQKGDSVPLRQRKVSYLFSCECCFSHSVAAIFLIITL